MVTKDSLRIERKLLRAQLKEAVWVLRTIAFGKAEGTYSMMHRRKLARDFIVKLEGKIK